MNGSTQKVWDRGFFEKMFGLNLSQWYYPCISFLKPLYLPHFPTKQWISYFYKFPYLEISYILLRKTKIWFCTKIKDLTLTLKYTKRLNTFISILFIMIFSPDLYLSLMLHSLKVITITINSETFHSANLPIPWNIIPSQISTW